MAQANPLINSFNGGELSPKISARSDITKYHSGCRTLENMIPLVEGGAMRMPGNYFVVETKTSSKASKLVPFHFSTIQAYILEFGENYIRVYKDEGQVLDAGNPVEITTTYAEEHLFELKFTQSADILYIFHPEYPPKTLTRTSHTNWTLDDFVAGISDAMVITGITKADPAVVTCANIPATFCECVAGGIFCAQWDCTVYIKGVVGMTEVNNRYFKVDNVVTGAGGTFELVDEDSTGYNAYVSGGTAQECLFGLNDENPSCGTFFEQRLAAAGTNNNPQTIHLSHVSDYDNFAIDTDDDSAGIEYTIASNRVDRTRWLFGQDYLMIGTVGGIFKMGASSAEDPITQTNVVCKKQISAGVKNIEPQKVADALLWVTRSGRSVKQIVYSFETDKYIAPDMTRVSKHIAMGATLATSGIVDMDIQSEPLPILWAVRADGQLIGMTYEVQEEIYAWFRIVTDGSFESVAVISDENEEDQIWVIVNRTIGGSTKRYVEYFKPMEFFSQIKDCFFVHSGLTWDGGDAEDIEGITNADPAVVTITGHSFENGDKIRIKDVEGMTEVNQGLDSAYTVANKAANTLELSGINSSGWGTYTSGGTAQKVKKDVTGLDHLEGESVSVLMDGAVHPDVTVDSGEVSLTYYGNLIHIGLNFTSIIEPSKIHVDSGSGSTRGKKKKIGEILLDFYETCSAKVGYDTDNLKPIPFGIGEDPELFTGSKSLEFYGDWGEDAEVSIVQDVPLPMTVLALVAEVEISG